MATYLHRPLRLQRRLNQIPRRALGVAFTRACKGPVWIAAGIGIASDTKTTQFHFDCVTRFLEAGKHVFAENPLGRSLAEIQTCFALSAKRKKTLFSGFQRRYDRNFRALKSKIQTLEPAKIIKTSSREW